METGETQFVKSIALTRDSVPSRASISMLSLITIIIFIIIGQGGLVWALENSTNSEDMAQQQLCSDCRLTSQSVDGLVRSPRQMDAYSQISERIDLEQIKKAICKEIISDKERERCRSFYFGQQPSVQKWKQSQSQAQANNKIISFFDFICVRELKVCCPEQSFGLKCSKCPKCEPNEQCQGQGTRNGNGTCVCKLGHTGIQCNNCLPGYYFDQEAMKLPDYSSKRIVCKKCHRSCRYCRTAGPKGCEVCQDGFTWQPGFGCLDIDECITSNNKICGPNTFCVNTEGSYFCYECDRACDGCHGDGPDMCLRCGKGYKLDSSANCVAERKTILPPEANYYRYAIYAGLCVSTFIILNNNVYLASVVGLGVAFYIGASEYVMSGHPGDVQDVKGNNLAASLSAAHSGISLPHLGL